MMVILTGLGWNLRVALFCISLMAKHTEHIFKMFPTHLYFFFWKQLGEKKVCFSLEFIMKGRQASTWSRSHGGTLLTGSLHGLFSLLSSPTLATCPEVAPPTMSWILPHRKSRNCPWSVSSLQGTLAYVKLKKNPTNTLCLLTNRLIEN